MSKSKGLPFVNQESKTIGELLEYICHKADAQSLLIACCTREYLSTQIAAHGMLNPDSPLLVATLRQMSASEKIRVVFCPDIQLFRAYITALPYQELQRNTEHIVVLNLLALHHGTSDFSIQGLSRTLAALASVNGTLKADMELVECSELGEMRNAVKGSVLWDEHVPLLSGSVKISEAGQGWVNLKKSIRSIAQRWIDFDNTNN